MEKGCSNGCLLNWFTPSASFKSRHIDGVRKPAMISLKKSSNSLNKHLQKSQFGIGSEIKKKLKVSVNQAQNYQGFQHH